MPRFSLRNGPPNMFGKKESSVKSWTVLLTFLFGLALGLSGPVFAPNLIDPYMPEVLQGRNETVDGTVKRKQREQQRLLLTISTPRGAILATFTERVTEIDLLIEERDRVTLRLHHYSPFVTNPRIAQVIKANESGEAVTPHPSGPTGPTIDSPPISDSSRPSTSDPAASGPSVSEPPPTRPGQP